MSPEIAFGALLVMGLFIFLKFNLNKEPPKPIKPSPCGDDQTHHYWVELRGWPCPICCANERHKLAELEEDRKMRKLAKFIAQETARHN